MTQEEIKLALRIFEKAMEDKRLLERSALYACLSVKAAKNISLAIDEQHKADRFEYEQAIEKADKERREEYRLQEEARKEALKNAGYYLVYLKVENYFDHTISYESFIRRSTRDTRAYLNYLFTTFKFKEYNYKSVAVYKVSKDDADHLLAKYKEANRGSLCKDLECASVDDFMHYLSECPSAEKMDLTGCHIGNAKVL